MEITLKIEGMQCGHCSSRVRAALEKVAGVASAEVSHETGTAVIKGENLDSAALRTAVEDQGFSVTDF